MMDENGEDCFERLNSMAEDSEWDQFHFVFSAEQEDEQEFEKLVSYSMWI